MRNAKGNENIIKQKRLDKNLSQQEFADLLHVSRTAISKWENGKHLPDTAKLAKISSLLGCTADELLDTFCTFPRK